MRSRFEPGVVGDMRTITMHRPAIIVSGESDVDREMRSARWTHHRLLDFEDRHQRLLDRVQERCAPGIGRVSRLVATLRKRKKRSERSTQWTPGCHPQIAQRLDARLKELRQVRNAHPLWKEALRRPRTPDAKAPVKTCRRKAGEDDTAFEARKAMGKRRSRRERYRVEQLYPRAHVYADTWNALVRSTDQAVAKVLSERSKGMPAEWRRPRWDDPCTIVADKPGHWRIVERGGGTVTTERGVTVGNPWWVLETRVLGGWVRFRAKLGNWHDVPVGAELKQLKLTRRKSGRGWSYTVSIAVEGMPDVQLPGTGVVALDWGHREHGHPAARDGIRAFTWLGDDGREGEVLVPAECRELRDSIDEMKARIDQSWNARKESMGLPERNRHRYRSRLLRNGVRTEEEQLWLTWEARYERRIARAWKRIQNLRNETYLKAVRELRSRYRTFVTEDEPGRHHQRLDTEEQTPHRKRQNRDLVARYEFLQICERLGASVVTVPARNTTRECPVCGYLRENTAELIAACHGCGTVSDKDRDAASTILKRWKEALANHAAE